MRNVPADAVHAAAIHDIGEEGSDMTRDIYVALFKDKDRAAARSLPDVSDVLYEDIGKASDMATPGGFRRGHVIANKVDDGERVPSYAQESFLDAVSAHLHARNIVQASYDDFVIANLGYGMSREDFLDEEDDDEANTPLVCHTSKLGQFPYKSFVSEAEQEESRGASVRKTVFTILKSFIGSGILFLPKAFQNGGMLFSIVGLFISAALSTFCMLRLTACSNAVMRMTGTGDVSYGQLGQRSFGRAGRFAVNVSLVLSQLGFCCSYLIFVEKNIGDIIEQVFHGNSSIASFSWTLILLQIPLYTPLTWVRRIEYFAMTNLIADVLILFGLIYIIGYSVERLEAAPPDSSTWENFNSKSWALFLGTAVYCFEGIGLVLPIYDAMDSKIQHKFPKIISLTVLFLVVLFSLFAGVVYAAFGQDTQSVVTLNLPNASVSGATMTVQITYSLALVLTYPLMLYPVVKILENYLFPQKRRVKGYWRWQKNGFRFALVCLTAAIAFFGKNQVCDSSLHVHALLD
ncbi:Vacuolar amino acid transporter, partial [Globisporangium splendens]